MVTNKKKIRTLSSFRKFIFKKGKRDWNLVDDELMKLVFNVLANIVHDDMKVKPRLFKRMALYKRQIRTLANTSQNIQDKRNFLNKYKNQKGGLLPIFAALIPLIAKIAAVAAPVIAKAATVASAAAPLLGKAALGVGSAAAAGATGAAVSHKLNG